MAVVLRLTRRGLPHKPFYRVVAADKQKKRDGRFLEIVGTFDPMQNPSKIVLKEDKVKKWLERGAVPSLTVRSLIRKNFPGLVEAREKHQTDKVVAARRARKERSKKAAKPSKKK